MTTKKKRNNHYIDNEKFLTELGTYKQSVILAKGRGEKPPGASNYIGQCFLDIANNLAKKPNFANYIFREEMVSDGIENCIMYATNFDETKSKNPFAFFTQIIFYAFLRRIQKEKKQLFVKMKLFEQGDSTGRFKNRMIENGKLTDDAPKSENPYANYFSLSDNDLKNFGGTKEPKDIAPKKRRKKLVKKNLEDLME